MTLTTVSLTVPQWSSRTQFASNVSVVTSDTGATVTFQTNMLDSGYVISITGGWATTFTVSSKTVSGFTITYGASPGSTSTLDVFVMDMNSLILVQAKGGESGILANAPAPSTLSVSGNTKASATFVVS